jgi:uncharacterized membrane protein
LQDSGVMAPATETRSTGLSRQVAVPLAYAGWWMTGLILWFLERRDMAIRFHAAQSMAAFGVVAALVIAFGVLAVASLSLLPAAFDLFLWAAAVTWALGVLLWIVAMWKAATGHAWRIPIAAELAERITRRA